jgi:FKBP-type peptidyl-prolyl cis-trans isomerase 2
VQEARQQQPQTQMAQDGESVNFAVVKGLAAGGPALPLYARDVKTGQGEMAGCWYDVTVRYRSYNDKGERVDDTTETAEPEQFTIGTADVIPGLERGVLGMRPGGVREITLQPSLAYGDTRFRHPTWRKNDYVGYVLTLLSTERPANLPFSDLGLRIYDDKEGTGPVAQCTDDVRIKLRAYDITGRNLTDPKLPAMIVRLGEGKVPYAIERMVMGMKQGGRRTAIVPPGYMQPLFAERHLAALQDDAEDASQEAVAEEPEAAEIQQAEGNATAEETNESAPLTLPIAEGWEEVTLPQDATILLEVELLPLQIEQPTN